MAQVAQAVLMIMLCSAVGLLGLLFPHHIHTFAKRFGKPNSLIEADWYPVMVRVCGLLALTMGLLTLWALLTGKLA